MKLKARIVSTILSMTLALGVMGFAVFAAATQTLTVTNTVNFVSEHVLATVEGVVTDAYAGTFVDYGPETTDTGSSTTQLPPWEIGNNMQFALETTPITITLTILNLSAERFFTFELSQIAHESFNGEPLGSTNINRSVTYSTTAGGIPVSGTYYDSSVIRVDASAEATIIIELEIADTGKSVNAFDNSFSVSLENEGEEVEGTLAFVFNPIQKSIIIPLNQELTYDNLPDMTIVDEPAFYGFYKSFVEGIYTQKISLPYEAEENNEVLYVKTGEKPTDLSFTLIEGDTEYSVYSVSATGDVEIPEYINGIPVTSIERYGFYYLTGLTSIYVPASVTNIGSDAFRNSTTLVSVLGMENILQLDDRAFKNCTNLATITGMDNVLKVGTEVFIGTTFLANKNPGVLYVGKVLYAYLGLEPALAITVDEGTSIIGENAFANINTLTSITIPNTVTSIENSAFFCCTNLEAVSGANGVTLIGYNAFSNTKFETDLYSAEYGLLYIGTVLYKNFSSAPTGAISILPGPTSIAGGAFYNDTTLTSIIIPEGVTSIGHSAFDGCTGLVNIVLPNSLKTIGISAFNSCLELTGVTIQEGTTDIGALAFRGCTNLASITIPSSVISIGESVFWGCTSLATVSGANNVEDVGNSAFYGTSYLDSKSGAVYIGKALYKYNGTVSGGSFSVEEGIISISNQAFDNCTTLTTITIPNSVTSIGTNTFNGCTGLTNVVIPNSVTNIGTYAFRNCINIESITLPNKLSEINSFLFQGCTNLLNVVIPDSVTRIRQWAFRDCTSLTSIIMNSITTIESTAFYGCSGLASITLPSCVGLIGTNAFTNCSILNTVIVDSATIANGLTSNTVYGNLINNIASGGKLFLKDTLTATSHVTSSFTLTTPTDLVGYNMYVKKAI